MANTLKDRLLGGVSRAASALGLPRIRAREPSIEVTRKAGKRGTPYRRVISYERLGPFHRQVGVKWIAGEGIPLMETFFKHCYFHATKGLRIYESHSAAPRIPTSPNLMAKPARLAFYGRPH